MKKSSKQLLNEYILSGGNFVRYEDVLKQSRKELRHYRVNSFLKDYGYILGIIFSIGFYFIYLIDWLDEDSI